MPEVTQERTGWRDERLSLLHREWGFDLPMVDIDFLVVEYDHARPVALIEYKHEFASKTDLTKHNYVVLANLGDAADLPVFIVRYADDFSWWRVEAVNMIAAAVVPIPRQVEQERYVKFLTFLRKKRAA